MDFIAYCYGDQYTERKFDPALTEVKEPEPVIPEPLISEVDLEALIKENAALKEELTARREEQQQTYVPKPLDISEFETRKIYIDSMLEDAGWIEGKTGSMRSSFRECRTSPVLWVCRLCCLG